MVIGLILGISSSKQSARSNGKEKVTDNLEGILHNLKGLAYQSDLHYNTIILEEVQSLELWRTVTDLNLGNKLRLCFCSSCCGLDILYAGSLAHDKPNLGEPFLKGGTYVGH